MQDSERLLAEIEQLRTTLEESLSENSRLFDAMTRQRGRIEEQAREQRLLASQVLTNQQRERWSPALSEDAEAQRGQTEEELRVAFEELQVMAEELEVANSSLQIANRELDARVEARTRELAAANTALQESETSFRAVVDLVPDFLWRTGRTGQALWYNRRWYEYTGAAEGDTVGQGWLEAVHRADRPSARMRWARAVGDGASFISEHRIRNAHGEYRWFLLRAEPLRDERGEVAQWFGAASDVHEQRVALEALRESELRFRTLVEGMPQLVWRSMSGGRWTWASPQWTHFTGLTQEASAGRGWLRAVHPEDRAGAEAAWSAADRGQPVEMEARLYCKEENRYRHFRTRANPVRSETGHVLEWLGTSTDVDDLLQLQQRQGVLVDELQHRTRNLISVVRSIATQTLRTSDSLPTFETEFKHRLAALARVQGLLSRSDEHQITIGSLIRMELEALGAEHLGDRIQVEGPEVRLRKSVVQTLALAIHELATNARKYGALHDDVGSLRVQWRLSSDGGAPRLEVDWREQTGRRAPAQVDGVRTSFGRELIENALPYSLGARTTFELTDSTLHCTIDLPLGMDDAPPRS